jgi:putative peptidoglycan lipid II flippase
MTEPAQPSPGPPGAYTAEAEASVIYAHAGIVTGFTLLSRILGMVRDLTIAHWFGAGAATDAWVQAFRIPNALRRLMAEGAMTIAFIPIYVRVREQEGREAALRFARSVLGIVLTATVVLTVLGFALSEPITALVSPGFLAHPEKFRLTAALIRWTFPYLIMVSLVAWAMGILNSEGRFAAPAAAPIFLNVGIIVAVVLFAARLEEPIMAIAWGVLAGGVAQVLLQGPSLRMVGVRLSPLGGWREPNVRSLFGLLVPSLFGVAVYELNIIVLGIIASFLPTGQIFHYHNATRLTELVMGLFAFAFTTAGLPRLSEHMARGDWAAFSETVRLTFAAVLYAILPAMAGLIAAAPGIVAMLYLHGAFGFGDVLSTAGTLRLLALGMPALAGVRVMVPIFYALGDARTPVAVSAATLVVTGALGWGFSLYWQVLGLALGLSAGTWFQCAVLAVLLKRKTAHMGGWFPFRSAGVQSLGAIACALFAYWGMGFGDWSQGVFAGQNWVVFVLVVLGAMAWYVSFTWLLGDAQARNWLGLLRRVLARLGGTARKTG